MSGRSIRFRVHSLSSQAEEGMAGRLPTGEGGWESARGCSYPQQLTLQLLLPIVTKSLTLVFHQYKIPNHVELFIKTMRSEKWRKLGFMRPSDNSQSGYEEKEQLTVFLEFPCSFVRLVMSKPYPNEYNLFQQVALEKVQLTGDLLPPGELVDYHASQLQSDSSEEESTTPGSKTVDDEPESEFPLERRASQQTKAIIRQEFVKVFEELESRKHQAVQREEYEEAASLKQRLSIFKELELRLNELQAAKRRATESEEYEKCAQLKAQIVLHRQTIEVEVNNFFSGRQSAAGSNVLSHYESTPQQVNITQLTAIPLRYTDYKSNASCTAEKSAQQKVSHDDQVLPAILSKAMNNNRERLEHPLASGEQPSEAAAEASTEQQAQQSKREPLDEKLFRRVEHYTCIPESVWREICTRDWRMRESAFRQLESLQISTKQQLLAAYELCCITMSDRHPNIIIHSLLMLTRIIHSEANLSLRTPVAVPQFLNQELLQSIISLFGDTNQKIRELSVNTFSELPQLAIVTTTQVIAQLIRPKLSTGKQSPKLQQIKLLLAKRLVEQYSISHSDMQSMLSWGVECLQDSNKEVRATATEFIVGGLTPHLGEAVIKKKVQHIRNNVLESFMAVMNQSLQLGDEDHSEFNHVHRAGNGNTLVQYEEYYAGRAEDLGLQSSRKPQQEAGQPEPRRPTEETKVLELSEAEQQLAASSAQSYCEYCLRPVTESMMTSHYENECKTLIYCEECGLLVYVADLTDHLLKDCEESCYQQCRRCRLAFPADDIYAHEAQNACKPLPHKLRRCQLCSGNVQDSDMAWVSHCEQCPSYQRNPSSRR